MKDNIKDYFIRQGDYILHLDETTQGDSPHLISTIDELSKFVLGNIKVISEKSGLIQPLLHDLKQNYRDAIAITTDMGKATVMVFPSTEYCCAFIPELCLHTTT